MKLRIVGGSNPEEVEKAVNRKIAQGAEMGLRLSDRLSTTFFDGKSIIYSLWFEEAAKAPKKKAAKTAVEKRLEFVDEPVEVERILMECFNARKLTVEQRKIITKVSPSVQDAETLRLFYRSNAKRPLDEQARLGMKRAFETMVNNLLSQIDVAGEWRKARYNEPEAIPEPAWDWRELRDHLAYNTPAYEGKEWADLNVNQQKYIARMSPK